MNQITEYQEYPKSNREYKSDLFCKTFDNKKYLLELYNGINKTEYDNEDDLEVNTLDNVVYMTMKNDISFLIDNKMSLYEHQSTENPNMPLRGLLYLAQLYNKYVAKHNLNLYSSVVQKIPIPQYIVFYNGTKEQPDEQIYLLSELFQKPNERQYVEGCLECQARMLNINYGKNRELMEKCRRLEEYAIFVAKVRKYVAENKERSECAITQAIDECIAEGILADILKEQKAEVLELVLSTFNKELYEQGLKEAAVQEANEKIVAQEQVITKQKWELEKKDEQLAEQDKKLNEQNEEIKMLKEKLLELTKV